MMITKIILICEEKSKLLIWNFKMGHTSLYPIWFDPHANSNHLWGRLKWEVRCNSGAIPVAVRIIVNPSFTKIETCNHC